MNFFHENGGELRQSDFTLPRLIFAKFGTLSAHVRRQCRGKITKNSRFYAGKPRKKRIFAQQTFHLMKKNLLLAALIGLASPAVNAQISLVNPVPHQVTSQQNLIELPTEWQVISTASVPEYVLSAVAESRPQQVGKADFTLRLGVVKDNALKRFKRQVPQHAEGYFLQVTPEGAVIVGADARGLYYGVQTLLQMMGEGRLEICEVSDWPDVAFRGSIEGFYGRPWSHEHRLRQLDFYGRHKMNVYIYGPKDDPYHRAHWRDPYPEDEAARIKELNERAKLRGVHFYWAIHPGLDIKWNDEDRQHLVAKLEKMYDLGIRSFAVFFDDIWGEGAKGEKQAALLNYVDDVFVKRHGDVAPLLLCPTEYNRAWSSDESPYLRALGDGLHQGIEVMWTGNSVVHNIYKEGMEWINSRLKRPAYIWWNYPVSDFVRDRLLLGPTYGNDLDIANLLSGFVSNPMQYAEASKISLYSVANYTWNMQAYNADDSWERALREVLPSAASALRTFATYNEDLGPNGHGFRRDESREIADICKRAAEGDAAAVRALDAQSSLLAAAADRLLQDKTNPLLIEEMRPWLTQAKVVADYGRTVCAMHLAMEEKWTKENFEDLYAQARFLKRKMYENENDAAQLHEYQTGTKLATLRYLPAVDRLFTRLVEQHNAAHGTALDAVSDYAPFHIESTVPQLALLPISVNGSEVKVTPSNEVIKWAPESQFTILCERPTRLAGMDFNFDATGSASDFRLDIRLENGEWLTIPLLHYGENDPVIHTADELGGKTVTAIRLTNISGKELQYYFRHFKISK